MDKSGIYRILNIKTKKQYVGSAVNLRKRKATHLYQLRNKRHYNIHLQRSFNKHGEENFIFEVLEEVDDIENILIIEQKWLDGFNKKKLYNIRHLASSNQGLRHTKQAKEKISSSKIGTKRSKRTREKISEKTRGNKHWNFGKKHKQETINKMSKSRCKRVVQIDPKTNRIIKTFSSAIEASLLLNISVSSISISCHTGKIRKGYIWRYVS